MACIAAAAFVSPDLDESLLGLPRLLQDGWGIFVSKDVEQLRDPEGDVVLLDRDGDGYIWLEVDLVAGEDGKAVSAVPATGVRAAQVSALDEDVAPRPPPGSKKQRQKARAKADSEAEAAVLVAARVTARSARKARARVWARVLRPRCRLHRGSRRILRPRTRRWTRWPQPRSAFVTGTGGTGTITRCSTTSRRRWTR